jgi:hypothetical protein
LFIFSATHSVVPNPLVSHPFMRNGENQETNEVTDRRKIVQS